MEERVAIVVDMIKSFAFAGTELTMTAFNKVGKVTPPTEPIPPAGHPPPPGG
jgi:hypothetical protein